MKQINIKYILGTLIFGILCFSIGVNAELGYKSEEIYYSSSGSNVKAALDELYPIKNELTNIKGLGTATAANILVNTSAVVKGTLTNGSMSNYNNTTKSITSITESGTNAVITIPSNGYYSTSSKLTVPIETIKTNVPSIITTLPNTVVHQNLKISAPVRYQGGEWSDFLVETCDYKYVNFTGSGTEILMVGYTGTMPDSGYSVTSTGSIGGTVLAYSSANNIDVSKYTYLRLRHRFEENGTARGILVYHD